MRRRNFLANLLAAGALSPSALRSQTPDTEVKRVFVLFKCHLDVGFIDTQANVIRKYFDQYFPQAIRISAYLRAQGGDRYVWTTGSWLIHQYLEKAAPAPRQRMEQAIRAGDIAWHALPFSWQTELMDPTLIAGGLGFSRVLDSRFGRTTTGAKMTDVPGHTRAIVGPLAEHGVKLLDIGVNSASTPPEVPSLFLWKDPAGRSLIMMYHPRGYGDVVKVPGSDLAVDIEVRGDNSGPHTFDEIHRIYAGLRKRFPNATVQASDLSTIANAVEPFRDHLPVVTQEIGDTWIYGVPSDPVKVARYCEIARLRTQWIAQRKFQVGDPTDLAFLANFLLEVEHTWGTDTKTWLDFDHYRPHDLAPMLTQPKYKVVLSSWAEKRRDLNNAISALPLALGVAAADRVRNLQPSEPDTAGMRPVIPGEPIETTHFTIGLDPQTGAISRLRSKKTGREWASPRRPIALFAYQTLSRADYERFFEAYLKSRADWASKDFGKPNIDRFGAQSRTWLASLKEGRHATDPTGEIIVARLRIADPDAEKAGRTAWPERLCLELFLPNAEPVIEVRFSWFNKPANRMPEAFWLTFQPSVADPRAWRLDKSGTEVSPFDVVTNGNRAMHAVLGGLNYQGRDGAFRIESLDAPVVALGERSPVYFSKNQPDLAKGFHFSLYNNAWGTNYIQWFGEDMRFRFRLSA